MARSEHEPLDSFQAVAGFLDRESCVLQHLAAEQPDGDAVIDHQDALAVHREPPLQGLRYSTVSPILHGRNSDAISHMRRLAKSPARVRSDFRQTPVRYAAGFKFEDEIHKDALAAQVPPTADRMQVGTPSSVARPRRYRFITERAEARTLPGRRQRRSVVPCGRQEVEMVKQRFDVFITSE